ncbi:MAG: hypothetical protein GY846_00515 [Deltaproteobacteria bacterium]|nr:hypothetical protein [Deltaproteobacteria bacterium]
MKKVFLSIFVIALVLCCGASPDVYAGQKIKIGIIQLLDHPDHKAMRESFLKAMKAQGYDVEVMEVFNADVPQYPKAYVQRGADKAKEMVKGGAQLIYSTAMYHAIKGATGDVPIVDAAFLSPVIMGNAKESNGKLYCTGNGTGTYLSYPFEEIVKFVKESMPEAKTIAYVYHPKSPVSRPIGEIKAAAQKVGLSVVDCPFLDNDGVMKAMEKTKTAPVAFLTNDVNLFGMQEKKAIQFALKNKIPVILGNISSVESGSLAGIQWDWNRAGEMCAQKTDAIMKGKKAQEIPIEMPDVFALAINAKTAETFKIAVPFEWLEAATKVVE